MVLLAALPATALYPEQAALLVPGIAVLLTSGYTQTAIVHGGRLDEETTLTRGQGRLTR